jgi:tetratricopeptide (TPR) repeat protein
LRVARNLTLGLVLLAGLLPVVAVAVEDPDILTIRAQALARDGQCGEALEMLGRLPAPTARSLLLTGQCQIEAKQFGPAVASLERAVALDPEVGEASLALAMARFHQGDYAGSRAALDTAAARLPDSAEVHLYDGILLLQAGQSEQAAAALARARELDPKGVEPMASYYEGIALAETEDDARAQDSLNRVIDLAPGTPWALQANRAMQGLDEGRPKWWAFARLGFAYDDNVSLLGTGLPANPSLGSNHDVALVYSIFSGAEVWADGPWALGVTATVSGSAYQDLGEFDQLYPVVGAWLDYRIDELTVARLRYEFGYGWLDYDPFVVAHNLTGSIYHDFGEYGRTEFKGEFFRGNYLFSRFPDVPDGTGTPGAACGPGIVFCGPPGINERSYRNRDGFSFPFGADHTIPVPALKTDLTLGGRYTTFNARGTEYSFKGPIASLATSTALPWDLQFRTAASYAYPEYNSFSSYPDPDDVFFGVEYPLSRDTRRDNIWAVLLELERYWTDRISTTASWAYVNQSSNVDVFNYNRQVMGMYVTYRFGE